MSDFIPKWHRELEIFSKIKPLIIIEGNVLDRYLYPTDGSVGKGAQIRNLAEYLHYFFSDLGYQSIAFYDSIRGFYNSAEPRYIENFGGLVNQKPIGGYIKADFKAKNGVPEIVKTALTQYSQATAVILNLASRYIPSPDNMEQSEVDSFTSLMITSLESTEVKTGNGNLKNIMVVVVNKVNDIPVWFYHNNPSVKTITLSPPTKEERELYVKGENFPSFFASDIYLEDNQYFSDKQDELEKIQDRFIALTEGFSFTELIGLKKLCKNERIRMNKMCDVIDLYKYGIKENPWNKLNTEELKNADEDFKKRVKGQDAAITKTLDVVKRAVTGMSGLQHSSHGKPKGILFFAGPTGTGKTALATAAGVEALQKGYTVAFYRMSDFCALIESKDPIGLARFRKRLKNVKCLILDDYGLTTLSDKVVAELNEIADVRYGLGSTIITSQLKKNGLKTLIAKSPIRYALADRLFRASDVEITLSGASWRGSANELKGAK